MKLCGDNGLSSGNENICGEIWIYAKYPEKVASQSEFLAARTLDLSHEEEWDDFRIVRAMLALTQVALTGENTFSDMEVQKSDKKVYYKGNPASMISFLTASCIPLKSLQVLYTALFDLGGEQSRLGIVEKKIPNDDKKGDGIDTCQKIAVEKICKLDSALITLSAADARAILQIEKSEGPLWQQFQHLIAPEEFYFSTILNVLGLDLDARSKPATYLMKQETRQEDLSDFIKQMKSIQVENYLYADKFFKPLAVDSWHALVFEEEEGMIYKNNDSPDPKRRRIASELSWRPMHDWPESIPQVEPFEHGWFLETHKRVLSQLLNENTKCIIELGSWYGASTQWIASKAKNATVYAIDIWDESHIIRDDHYRNGNTNSILKRHPLYATFLRNLWFLRDRVIPLRYDTVAGLKLLKDHNIQPDLIYIDADHHYNAVKRDILTCIELFPQAILVGDDYGHYDDVKRAVCECAFSYGKRVYVDQHHCWTYAAHLPPADTARIFRPEPPATSSFASLLAGYNTKS
eukprot:CAMPEP_0197320210 /NCGR_PEP_ID=MMETSP0891-20130614/58264_1 /TAXON_ID=44058 ORGANISM="Aureoumbra lagunensis, Strain CCMP1510" /NCGR_SAMPLE_ID=MMETSP0891 /ASSEMBLY_ACC=CAM_ASM_000534 /LENGTH=519 /DNA_ID=CAMNT_0042811477 /DNA_START=32 /DNA_END=1590 /DNA_ORIENTATION=+